MEQHAAIAGAGREAGAGAAKHFGAAQNAAPDTAPVPRASGDRVPLGVWVIATLFVALEVALAGRYGYQQDELYFLVAGHHLALGYVDQPPLTPLLTRLVGLVGTDPVVIRILPALFGGAVVVAAGRQAALFGAGRTGRVLAALGMACAPVLLGSCHVDNTTPPALLAWALVVLWASTAVLRGRPRWWLGAGLAAGLGLENNNLVVLLMGALALGLLLGGHAGILRTKWPWLAAGIAALLWAPNAAWQAAQGWPQLAMASSLRQENDSLGDYLAGLPGQLVYAGLLAIPLFVAGVVRLWRRPELRFLAVVVTLVMVYVLAWVPGKVYYASGVLPAVLAAGSVSAEGWLARARRPRAWRVVAYAALVVSMAVTLPDLLPVWPVGDLHAHAGAAANTSDVADTVGWPQLARAVAAQDAALADTGQPPTAIFTGGYPEAAAIDVLGPVDRLPPVLSGHNAYGTWGPGHASDRTVLAVDAVDQLRPYFAQCRHVATFDPPYQVHNDFTDLDMSVCTGPTAGWATLWPHLTHDD